MSQMAAYFLWALVKMYALYREKGEIWDRTLDFVDKSDSVVVHSTDL